VIYGSHVHPDLPGGPARPAKEKCHDGIRIRPAVGQNKQMCPSFNWEGNVMPEFTIGSYLGARLEQIGIRHYFMVPGDYNLVLLDQLLANKNMQQIGCVTSSTRPTPPKPMPGSTAAARSLPP
jgi:hypothetical protein